MWIDWFQVFRIVAGAVVLIPVTLILVFFVFKFAAFGIHMGRHSYDEFLSQNKKRKGKDE